MTDKPIAQVDERVIATMDEGNIHYMRVVLRDCEIDRIAKAVVAAYTPSQPIAGFRDAIFDVLRFHDVSEQCFAEIAMLTHAVPSQHSELVDEAYAALERCNWAAHIGVTAARKMDWVDAYAEQLIAALRAPNTKDTK